MLALGRFAPWILVCALLASLALLRPLAEARRPSRLDFRLDVPAIPADVVRPLALGLRSVIADLMLLQAIQIHGGRRTQTAAEGAPDDHAMARLLDYATDLDPLYGGAYRFAGSGLIRHTSDGKATGVFAAAQILMKGVRERNDDWRIPFYLGFIQSFYLNRNAEAAQAMRKASGAPGAPSWVGLLATRLASEAGDLEMAQQLAQAMIAQAPDDAVRAEWETRLLDVQMEVDLRRLERVVAKFRERTGKPPPSLQALVDASDLPAIPREPHGGRYLLGPDGAPRSSAAQRLKLRKNDTRWGLEVQ